MVSRSQRHGPRTPRPDPQLDRQEDADWTDVPAERPEVLSPDDPSRPRGRGDQRAAEFGRAGGRQQFHNAQQFLLAIEDMQDSGKFSWAPRTLDGIAKSVEERMYVTAGQRQAVDNIRRSKGWDPLDEA